MMKDVLFPDTFHGQHSWLLSFFATSELENKRSPILCGSWEWTHYPVPEPPAPYCFLPWTPQAGSKSTMGLSQPLFPMLTHFSIAKKVSSAVTCILIPWEKDQNWGKRENDTSHIFFHRVQMCSSPESQLHLED